MDDYISRRKSNATGGSIGISILLSGRCGHGTTSASGATSNGRNTGLHRSYGPLPRITSSRSQAITNCVATMEAVLRSPIFGLLPEFIGRGLGGPLLTSAIEEAWRTSPSASRVWVHTCNLDHPSALGNYQARGMVS